HGGKAVAAVGASVASRLCCSGCCLRLNAHCCPLLFFHDGMPSCWRFRPVPDTQKPLGREGRPLGSPWCRCTGRLAKQEDRTHTTTVAVPRCLPRKLVRKDAATSARWIQV